MLWIRLKITTPIIDPTTPPCPPLRRVPPKTTATMDCNMRSVPPMGFPVPVLRASASAPAAASSPAIQYERKRTDETGTPLTNADRSCPPVAYRYGP
jgi:hypothetical protein